MNMSPLDDLNQACAEYALKLSDKWKFTGWKPGQGNTRLHAQWLRADEYDGERYYSEVQCFPMDLGDVQNVIRAKDRMKSALEGVSLLDRLAPEPIPWGSR
jgi:hypothetical protein